MTVKVQGEILLLHDFGGNPWVTHHGYGFFCTRGYNLQNPQSNPDPWVRVQVFTGTGKGTTKITLGLPTLFTIRG